MNCITSDSSSDKLDGDDHPDIDDELKSVSLDMFSDKDTHLNSLDNSLGVLIGMGSDDGMGEKSRVGSMHLSAAGVGQNAGVENTLMVVSPFKSLTGETGVKEVNESIELSLRTWN